MDKMNLVEPTVKVSTENPRFNHFIKEADKAILSMSQKNRQFLENMCKKSGNSVYQELYKITLNAELRKPTL